jgi:uncharacterized membrane protein YhaH (DUF805 family)
MLTKTEIINNLREYSSDQIVDAIRAGVVSVYELSKSGKLTPLMRKRIEEKLAATPPPDEEITEQAADAYSPITPKEKPVNVTPQPSEPSMAETEDEDLFRPISAIGTGSESKSNADSHSAKNDEEMTNKKMYRNPFSFKGRIRRTEYWVVNIIIGLWYVSIVCLSAPAFNVCEYYSFDEAQAGIGFLYIIAYVPVFWIGLAQNCKRCHDRGHSGWWQLIPFYNFVLLFGDSEPGDNKFGDNPKN